jgi:hypothetical protein
MRDGFRLFAFAAKHCANAAKFQKRRAPMFGFWKVAPKRKKAVDGTVTIGSACAPGEEPR